VDVTSPPGTPYSCPLDTPHLWAALRYTEPNPSRRAVWRRSWTPGEWLAYLADGTRRSKPGRSEQHRNTHTGRPLGTDDFLRELETMLERRLAPAPGGGPSKQRCDETQIALGFAS
jgi:hypothetical protein